MGYPLWRGYCYRLGIKDSISATHHLCRYTWEIVVCIVLTGEERVEPDILPETPQQAERMESMIRTIWNTEAIWRQKGSKKPDCPLTSTDKKARYLHTLLFCD